MAKQERTRKSAPRGRARSFDSVARELVPPFPMADDELARFDAIIVSRERDSWTPADVYTAARMAQMEVEADALREEYLRVGQSIEDKSGKRIVNPDFTAYNALLGQLDKFRRSLGLSASQRGIAGHKQARRNQQDAVAAEKLSNISGLIARPK